MLRDDVDLRELEDDAGIHVVQVEADRVVVDHFEAGDLVPDVAEVERLVLLDHVEGEFYVGRVERLAVRPFDARRGA